VDKPKTPEEIEIGVLKMYKRYYEGVLKDISTWRERCWEYDDDAFGEKFRRSFVDEEEWERAEKMASGALKSCAAEETYLRGLWTGE
jgi:hypothetical protein